MAALVGLFKKEYPVSFTPKIIQAIELALKPRTSSLLKPSEIIKIAQEVEHALRNELALVSDPLVLSASDLFHALKQLAVRFPIEHRTTDTECQCNQFLDNLDCRHTCALRILKEANGGVQVPLMPLAQLEPVKRTGAAKLARARAVAQQRKKPSPRKKK